MSNIRNKKYSEEYARQSLHFILGCSLENLLLKETPDLQDVSGNYGIEVVRDFYEIEQQHEEFIERIFETPYSQIDTKKIRRYQKGGGRIYAIGDQIRSASLGIKTRNTPDHLLKTIRGKTELLNSGNYHEFPCYGLYVFVDTVFIDDDACVRKIIEEVSRYTDEKTFRTIYLNYFYGICVCDINNREFKRFPISPETRDDIKKAVNKTLATQDLNETHSSNTM